MVSANLGALRYRQPWWRLVGGARPPEELEAAERMLADPLFRRIVAGLGPWLDLIFTNGWHEHEQVYRDVVNSLEVLSHAGTIVLHDCNPSTEAMQRVPQVQGEWTRDCWKAIARLPLRQ